MDSVEEAAAGGGPTLYSRLASTLWHCDPDDETTLILRERGRKRRVRGLVDMTTEVAETYELPYTIVDHPRNRWWRRRCETTVYIPGTCGELIQFLNVLEEVRTEEYGS